MRNVELATDHSEIEHLSYALSNSADWWRFKAREYPNDAERNLKAALQLDRLAAEAADKVGSDLDRSLREAHERAYRLDADYYANERHDAQSQLVRGVGFGSRYDNIGDFVQELIAGLNDLCERIVEEAAQ